MSRYKAKCEKCRYRDAFIHIVRCYELGAADTIPVEQTFVWCQSCKRVQWGEHLPEFEAIEQELNETEGKNEQRIESLKQRYVGWAGTLDELVTRRVHDLHQLISWRQERSSPARCLECGSVNIVQSIRSQSHRGNPKWTLHEHPACGGLITVLIEPALTLSRQQIFYTAEGKKLQTYEMSPSKGRVPVSE